MQVNVIQTFGLPHSDTRGSSDIGSYPRLFAASHVLLRLAAPRHPPWTLIRLTILFISSLRYECKNQMGQIRLELMTPALSERCSNQLSYCPIFFVVLNNQRKERRKGRVPKGNRACSTPAHSCLSLRKEVIQPHLPVRLPCYDFTPLTRHTFGSGPHCWLTCRLRVSPTRMV